MWAFVSAFRVASHPVCPDGFDFSRAPCPRKPFYFCYLVTKLCLTIWDPMTYSTPDFPALYYLPEFAQTHIHWLDDAIQSSHPLLLSSPIAFSLSQHQSLFQCQLFASDSQSIGASASVSVHPLNIQDWFPLGLVGLISFLSTGFSRVFSAPQFESINSLALSLLYGPTLTSIHDYWKNHSFDYMVKVMSLLFNMLSRFVIVFIPRSKYLLIHGCSHHLQWFWSPRK